MQSALGALPARARLRQAAPWCALRTVASVDGWDIAKRSRNATCTSSVAASRDRVCLKNNVNGLKCAFQERSWSATCTGLAAPSCASLHKSWLWPKSDTFVSFMRYLLELGRAKLCPDAACLGCVPVSPLFAPVLMAAASLSHSLLFKNAFASLMPCRHKHVVASCRRPGAPASQSAQPPPAARAAALPPRPACPDESHLASLALGFRTLCAMICRRQAVDQAAGNHARARAAPAAAAASARVRAAARRRVWAARARAGPRHPGCA